MSQSLGDLKLNIVLDILKADQGSRKFTASLKNVELQERKTTESTRHLNQTLNNTSERTTRLAGVLTNAGLRIEGFTSVIRLAKSTLGDFFREYNKFTSAQSGVSSIALFKDINPADANDAIKNLQAVKAGLLDVSSASTSLKNLLAANFSLEQSIALINRLSEASAFGRQSSLSFGEAVSSATEGIKNGNSILVDNAGVTKNLSIMLEEAGFKAQDLMTAGQNAGVRMAIFNGILKETEGQVGDIIKISNTSAGQLTKFESALTNLKIAFGKYISEAALPFLQKAGDILKWLIESPPYIQKLSITLTILGAAFITLNRSIGTLPYILITLAGLATALPPDLKILAIALGAVAIAMKLLGGRTSDVISGFQRLRTDGISSITSFASTAIGKFNAIGIAISLSIGWITMLIDKIIDLEEETKNLEYWEKKRKSGATIIMTTPDGSEMNITDPSNIQNMDNFVWTFDGNKFVGSSQNEINVTSDQRKSNEENLPVPPVGKLKDTKEKVEEAKDAMQLLQEKYNSLIDSFERPFKMSRLEKSIELMERLGKPISEILKVPNAQKLQETESTRKPIEEVKGKFGKSWDFDKMTSEDMQQAAAQSLSLAQQTASILGIGADSFAGKFLGALQEGLSLANTFANFLNVAFSIGSGGIFGLLGLAGGGQVPGSGQGDTVPAMLTPGEYVIRKSVVNKIGSGFFEWINGGGLFNSIAGRYAQGGMVTGAGSGGVQVVVLETRVKGSDIALSQARESRKTNRRII